MVTAECGPVPVRQTGIQIDENIVAPLDRGCHISPHCTDCPLPVCIHERRAPFTGPAPRLTLADAGAAYRRALGGRRSRGLRRNGTPVDELAYHRAYAAFITELAAASGLSERQTRRVVEKARRYSIPLRPETCDMDAFIALWNDGLPIQEIARRLSVSRTVANTAALQARDAGLARPRPRPGLGAISLDAAVARLYRDGLRGSEIASRLGISVPRAWQLMAVVQQRGLVASRPDSRALTSRADRAALRERVWAAMRLGEANAVIAAREGLSGRAVQRLRWRLRRAGEETPRWVRS